MINYIVYGLVFLSPRILSNNNFPSNNIRADTCDTRRYKLQLQEQTNSQLIPNFCNFAALFAYIDV